jgi:hypothetical protein
MSRNELKASVVSSVKGILAATAIFAAYVFSPLWIWGGHVPLTTAQAIAVTLEFSVVITAVFVLTELLKWLWPNS